ncbi:STAS domain-containing protein [bacterium LRH843]|nr:STAS domain-containing protein [bacterium LRH843]
MESSITSFIVNHRETLIERWKNELVTVRHENQLISVSDSFYEKTNHEFTQFIIELVTLDPEHAKERLSAFAIKYIQGGWPLSYFTRGLQAFQRTILVTLSEVERDVDKLVSKYSSIDSWIDGIINQLVYDYSGSWEDVFELQKLSLLELSTPLIPVFEGVTVMPLIGTIDTARAKLIMEKILEGVIKHRSEVVLIDITGIPVVDTMVAQHITKVSEAVRLVGTTCILVGIRPEIAQTIVNLGIDLSRFPTKSTLKGGIESALEMLNKKMIDL